MLLAVHKVAKLYGSKCILKDVSCSVESYTLTLLMGANGAGKSTLLRIMAGLLNPSVGEVRYCVAEGAIGYLGHASFLYPALTARENLRFWADMYGIESSTDILDAVLTRVGLRSFALEKAGIFSRGMAQRLNLARILLLRPALWLLDEPGTGLDIQSAELLRREIIAARNAGAGIVWISHDKAADSPLADRILTLEHGCLFESTVCAKQNMRQCATETVDGVGVC